MSYIIEGGINFYDELYKSLDESPNKDSNSVCLITGLPLTENFVTMECKHTFNYIPLFNDICNHKKKYNSMERKMLKSTEIRCPYCRHVQTTLLPYYENMNVKQIHGVNYFSETANILNSLSDPSISPYLVGECCYKYKSGDQLIPCSNTKVTLVGEKLYCIGHRYLGKVALIKEIKLKEKMDIKQKMMLAKQKLAEEKLLAKEEAIKQKQLLKQNKINSIEKIKVDLGLAVVALPGCQQILTSGKNKGAQCCCLKIHTNNMCLRHHNLLNKHMPVVESIGEKI
uniref:RING-type domain-containing protein n=1 Tax=viral metagenome TaxID=1070528 RepID=A0A6C0HYZ5_9ZZZZ